MGDKFLSVVEFQLSLINAATKPARDFMRDMFKVGDALKRSRQSIEDSMSRANKSLSDHRFSLERLRKSAKKTWEEMRDDFKDSGFQDSLEEVDTALGTGLGGAFSKLAGPAAGATALYAMGRAAYSTEEALLRIRKVTNASNEDLEQYRHWISEVAIAYGESEEEVAAYLVTAADMKIPMEQTREYAGIAAQLTDVLNMSADGAAQFVGRLMQFNELGPESARKVADSMVFLRKETKASVETLESVYTAAEEKLLRQIPKAMRGKAIPELLAAGAAMADEFGDANFMVQAFESMTDMSASNEAGALMRDMVARGLGVTTSQVNKMIQRGELANVAEGLVGGLKKANASGELKQYAQDFEGIYQIAFANADVLNNMEAGRILDLATNAHAASEGMGALNDDFEAVRGSWPELMKNFGASGRGMIKAISEPLGDLIKDGLVYVADWMRSAITWFNELNPQTKKWVSYIVGGTTAWLSFKAAVWPVAKILGKALLPALQGLYGNIKSVIMIFPKFIGFVKIFGVAAWGAIAPLLIPLAKVVLIAGALYGAWKLLAWAWEAWGDDIKKFMGGAWQWMVTQFNDFLAWIETSAIPGLQWFFSLFTFDNLVKGLVAFKDWAFNVGAILWSGIADVGRGVWDILGEIGSWIAGIGGMLWDSLKSVGGKIIDFFKDIFRTVGNFFIDIVNKIIFGANDFLEWVGLDIQPLEKFAKGGIAKATPGGIPALVAEGGRDELIQPIQPGGIVDIPDGLTPRSSTPMQTRSPDVVAKLDHLGAKLDALVRMMASQSGGAPVPLPGLAGPSAEDNITNGFGL